MKIPLLLPLTILAVATVTAYSQEGPRTYDNFDTSRGPKVYATPFPKDNRPVIVPPSAAATKRPIAHYPASPRTGIAHAEAMARWKEAASKLPKEPAPAPVQSFQSFNGVPYTYERPETSERLIMGVGSHLKGHSTGDDMVDAFIVDSSRRYSIDPLLIYAQMNQESGFKRYAKSNKGASGLMQLMPATARRLGVTDIYDRKQNIEGGVKYMRMLLNMFSGDLNLALAGYNAGEGAVMKYGYQIPPYRETQDYVRRISARYRAISNAKTVPYLYVRPNAMEIASVEPKIDPPPVGRWESGTEMLRRYAQARSQVAR